MFMGLRLVVMWYMYGGSSIVGWFENKIILFRSWKRWLTHTIMMLVIVELMIGDVIWIKIVITCLRCLLISLCNVGCRLGENLII